MGWKKGFDLNADQLPSLMRKIRKEGRCLCLSRFLNVMVDL